MNKSFINLVIAAALAAVVWCEATSPVEQCENEHFEELQDRIKVMPCGSKKCKLTKLTNTTVAFKFKLKEEVKDLTNEVYATLAGIPLPLPFPGVSGQSACGNVHRADTGEHVPCPLKPDVDYVYENVFFIELIYPVVDLRVHWSLNDGRKTVICFEVPAQIVNAKNKSKKGN